MKHEGLMRARRMKLSTKLMLTIFPLLLIPCLIGGGLWLRRTAADAYEGFEKDASAQLSELRQHLAGNAELVANSASVALGRRDFLQFCAGDMDADGLRLVKFAQNEMQDMRCIFQSNPLIQKASFYFDNEDVYEIWPLVYHGGRLLNTPYEDLALRGQSGRYLTEPSEGNISCCYAVYLDVTQIGVLVLDLDLEPFLGPLYEDTENNYGMALLPLSGGCFAKEGTSLPAEMDIRKALPGEAEQQAGIYPVDFKSSDAAYCGVCMFLPLLDSWAVVLADRGVLMSGPRQTAFRAAGLFIIAAVVIWLLVQYICRSLLRRLSVLEANMLQIQNGALQVRVPERENGGDELDTLAHSFNRMLDRTERLMEENVERELAAKEAELNALQSQINSHFLYNALESIRMKAELRREPEIADTIVSLGSLLRYHMTWKDRTVTLGEELECVRRYVSFSSATGKAELHLEVAVGGSLLACEIPKLCIQPLVENAIVHGLPSGSGKLSIRIYASCEAGTLRLFVEDDGAGISPKRLAEIQAALCGMPGEPLRRKGNGIGILNVHRRLVTAYGPGAGLSMESVEGQRTRACVALPYDGPDLGGW